MVFHAFDPVTVQLSLDSSNIQHEKIIFQLVEPFIEGFSIVPKVSEDGNMSIDETPETTENLMPTEKKRRQS